METRGERRGPKTAIGRAVVRTNPIRHGVLSQAPVIPLVERTEDWHELRDEVREYYDATGVFEGAMADRIAGLVWRLQRVVRLECETVLNYLREVPRVWRMMRLAAGKSLPEELTAEAVAEMDAMLVERLLPGDETMDKVLRYETKLHRFLLQSMHQMALMKGWKGNPGSGGLADLDPPGMPSADHRWGTGTRRRPRRK